jgi:hypothetical protein
MALGLALMMGFRFGKLQPALCVAEHHRVLVALA